jgi:hypothetical protein
MKPVLFLVFLAIVPALADQLPLARAGYPGAVSKSAGPRAAVMLPGDRVSSAPALSDEEIARYCGRRS